MPIVEISGNFSSVYSWGSIRVNEYGVEPSEFYNSRLRHRGATASGKSKKAYAIKLYDSYEGNSLDRSFFGLRSDNNWILDAMAVDRGRIRNRITTDLWNDFSADPYPKASEPTMVNGTRVHFVEVILNGEYHGLYCMTEKIDRKQLKFKNYQEAPDNVRGRLY